MSGGKIIDVYKISDAGAVRRRVVGSKNRHGTSNSKSGAQNVRNQMRFRIVMLPVIVPRAGSVEIAQNGVAQAMNSVKPLQHDFGQIGRAHVGTPVTV